MRFDSGCCTSFPVCLLSLWCEHPCMAAAITSTHVTPLHDHTSAHTHTHTLRHILKVPCARTLTIQPSKPRLNLFLCINPTHKVSGTSLTKHSSVFSPNVFTHFTATPPKPRFFTVMPYFPLRVTNFSRGMTARLCACKHGIVSVELEHCTFNRSPRSLL